MNNGELIRVGIIGAGANTKLKHIPGFQAIEGVSVDVICNRTVESSKQAADAFGVGRIASNWEDVIQDDSIDAICIGTWPYLHAPITIAALNAGKHVLTEARMAMNADEAADMLAASRSNPGLVAQIVPSPFTLKWDATITDILQSGELGRLLEISVTKTIPMNADQDAPMNWRQNIEYSGNNILMLGIYYEVIQRWIKREPNRVWAHGSIYASERMNPESNAMQAIRIPETITYMADYADGLQLTGLMSGVERGSGRDAYALCGANGTIRLDLASGKLFKAINGESETIVEPASDKIADWNVEADFIQSIREKTSVNLTNFEDGLNYMRFTDAVRKSFDSNGAWVELPS